MTLQLPRFPGDDDRAAQARRRFLKKSQQFYLDGERMFKRNGDRAPLLVIFDPERRKEIMRQAHDLLGHRGVDATLHTIQIRFFWPHARSLVHNYVRSCHECQIRTRLPTQVPLTPSIPTTIFAKVYIDIMYMPLARGFRYLVAAKDDLSGVSEARPLRRATAKALAKFFWEEIYCRYGIVLQATTDNGPEVKDAFELLTVTLGVPHVKISPYNSRANGVVERGHFILRESIIKACEGNISLWPLKVAPSVFADRVTVRRATGQSPYFTLHGFEPILPFDLADCTFMIEGWKSHMEPAELLALRTRQIERRAADLLAAAERLMQNRFRSKAEFERRYHARFYKEEYFPDELVLVRNSRISSLGRKFTAKWLGPYAIVRRTHGGSYVIRELSGAMSTQGVAATRLLPYIARDDPRLVELATALPTEGPMEVEGYEEMDVNEEEEAAFAENDEEDV
jgi:transposase InsO family protein